MDTAVISLAICLGVCEFICNDFFTASWSRTPGLACLDLGPDPPAWRPAAAPGRLAVFPDRALQEISGRRFPAAVHRVEREEGPPRLALVYELRPRTGAPIAPSALRPRAPDPNPGPGIAGRRGWRRRRRSALPPRPAGLEPGAALPAPAAAAARGSFSAAAVAAGCADAGFLRKRRRAARSSGGRTRQSVPSRAGSPMLTEYLSVSYFG
eukprot:tig00000448_g888.t1